MDRQPWKLSSGLQYGRPIRLIVIPLHLLGVTAPAFRYPPKLLLQESTYAAASITMKTVFTLGVATP